MQRRALQHAWDLFETAVTQFSHQQKWQETTSTEHTTTTMTIMTDIEDMQAKVEHMQERLNSKMATSFSKFVLRMMNNQVSSAFHTWQTNVKESLRVAFVLGRAVQRMLKTRYANWLQKHGGCVPWNISACAFSSSEALESRRDSSTGI